MQEKMFAQTLRVHEPGLHKAKYWSYFYQNADLELQKVYLENRLHHPGICKEPDSTVPVSGQILSPDFNSKK